MEHRTSHKRGDWVKKSVSLSVFLSFLFFFSSTFSHKRIQQTNTNKTQTKTKQKQKQKNDNKTNQKVSLYLFFSLFFFSLVPSLSSSRESPFQQKGRKSNQITSGEILLRYLFLKTRTGNVTDPSCRHSSSRTKWNVGHMSLRRFEFRQRDRDPFPQNSEIFLFSNKVHDPRK